MNKEPILDQEPLINQGPIMNQTPIKSILILHAFKDELEGLLERAHPQLHVSYAQNTREAEQQLNNVHPDAIFAVNHTALPSDTMRMAGKHPSVKWFHVAGSGIDKMLPWSAQDALMTNGAGVLAKPLAETVTGAMLAMNNNLHLYQKQQRAHQWQQHQFTPLCEQTLLIIGLGEVGKRVADNAKALGMRVIAVRRSQHSYENIDALYTEQDLPAVLNQADFVSLHLPLTDSSRNLFDQSLLNQMKKGACLINTARGGIVDEQALINNLTTGYLKAAFFDVFAQEPLPDNSPLWDIDNLLISPHMADSVVGFVQKYLQFFSENVTRYNQGKALKNQLTF